MFKAFVKLLQTLRSILKLLILIKATNTVEKSPWSKRPKALKSFNTLDLNIFWSEKTFVWKLFLSHCVTVPPDKKHEVKSSFDQETDGKLSYYSWNYHLMEIILLHINYSSWTHFYHTKTCQPSGNDQAHK